VVRLILVNGPAGLGKSTLARRYCDLHPLALDLDVDRVRALLGRWQDQPEAAGLTARALALAMARVHLGSGHDVIVPQYLGRPQFIQQAEKVAAEVGVPFAEFVLMDSRDSAVQRFLDRTAAAATPAHIEAGALMDQFGGRPALEAMYDRLLLVLSHRPDAQVIQSRDAEIDAAYLELAARLAS
jgi:predicted kinase